MCFRSKYIETINMCSNCLSERKGMVYKYILMSVINWYNFTIMNF